MRDPRLWWPQLLVTVTLAVYSRACFYEFINYDDDDYVYENPDVLAGLSIKGRLGP